MKTKNGFCIAHHYSGSIRPSIVSTHRTLSGAEAQLARRRASFRAANPRTGLVRAICPLSIRRLIDGEAGDCLTYGPQG